MEELIAKYEKKLESLWNRYNVDGISDYSKISINTKIICYTAFVSDLRVLAKSSDEKCNCNKPHVSKRYLQCSASYARCIKNESGIRKQSLKKCVDCKYSLISERKFEHMPTIEVNYHEDKDNWTKELWKRTLS